MVNYSKIFILHRLKGRMIFSTMSETDQASRLACPATIPNARSTGHETIPAPAVRTPIHDYDGASQKLITTSANLMKKSNTRVSASK